MRIKMIGTLLPLYFLIKPEGRNNRSLRDEARLYEALDRLQIAVARFWQLLLPFPHEDFSPIYPLESMCLLPNGHIRLRYNAFEHHLERRLKRWIRPLPYTK
ncbi:hypothetical protein CC78DRAFT_589510 [Lojkania enalia]|uniref:Uncharacterized protein n=1 Tax=Lojkania enalia TaxID=147567 RepID=A0A9P4MWT5_9PLEO|nr:hypothetical protein CC78DRAFT_589510 [Didymosphaeria enalia]